MGESCEDRRRGISGCHGGSSDALAAASPKQFLSPVRSASKLYSCHVLSEVLLAFSGRRATQHLSESAEQFVLCCPCSGNLPLQEVRLHQTLCQDSKHHRRDFDGNGDHHLCPTRAEHCLQRHLQFVISLSSILRQCGRHVMHFPGSDQSDEECDSYDPRIRPWYCTSASVTKAVMVLLDVGESMGRKAPYPLEGSIFNVSQTIALALLNTLSTQDYVNIITFNSISTTLLASSPVKVLLDNFGSSASPEFDWLKANLTSLKDLNLEANGQPPSNISLGIAEALRNYGLLNNESSAMEIIVAFTDGDAKNLKDGALAALVGRNKTKVFIFKLPQPNEANQFLNEAPAFLTQLHNIGGSFNVIKSVEALNPLYSILPYFSFLANVRANISSSADYSSIYEDFEHIVNKVFSITKPVFDENQTLLGVVGQNIFVDELGSLTGLCLKRCHQELCRKHLILPK